MLNNNTWHIVNNTCDSIVANSLLFQIFFLMLDDVDDHHTIEHPLHQTSHQKKIMIYKKQEQQESFKYKTTTTTKTT